MPFRRLLPRSKARTFGGTPFAYMNTTILAGGFGPSNLFRGGEPGIWLDPSDLTTLFQDRAGTTPVTAPGQSVGLILDKSRGLVLGPELVTNGDVSSGATGWTLGSGWSVTGGALSFDGSAIFSNVSQAMSLVQGRTYLITFTSTGTIAALRAGGPTSGSNVAVNITGSGAKTFRVTCVGLDGSLYFVSQSSATASIDNISVRELPGFHAVANSDAARGIYGIEPFGGRRNLLTFSEQFDNAAWGRNAILAFGSGSVANASSAPDGNSTADLIVPDTSSAAHYMAPVSGSGSVGDHTFSVYVKPNGYSRFGIREQTGGTAEATFLLSGSGSVIGVTGATASARIDAVDNGYYRVQVESALGGASQYRLYVLPDAYTSGSLNTYAWNPNGTSGILIWGAQLETGSTATNYQRVTTAFDVTEAGVPTVHYVQFDGADDGYLTSTITPGTDKAQVFAGVRKLSDAAEGIVVEHSNTTSTGSFDVLAAPSTSATYRFRSRGTGTALATSAAAFSAPITNILTGLGDIAGDSAILRVNGTQVAQSAADQGTGNFLAYPLFIGRRGGTTLPFNGRLYSLIVRFGPNLTADQIARVERFIAQRTGVTI